MKLNDRMRYPHPVLSEFSPDYVSSEFRCSFEQQMIAEAEIKIAAELALDLPDIHVLIKNQRAATGYFLICRRTYFNFLQEAPIGKSDRFFDVSKLFGTVAIRPVVWTLTEVGGFSSPLMNKEFGRALTLPKGSIIALGPEFRFSVDKKKFKPFESIFELAELPEAEPGTIVVDATRDRITILAEPKTYKSLAGMRNMPAGRDILLNSVYMPAVMDVLASLQNGDNSLTGKSWYRVFKAKCDDIGIDPTSSKESPLLAAQKLLKAPLKKSIAIAEKF